MSFKKSIFATIGLNIYSFAIGLINSILSTRILGAEGKGIFAIYSSSIELLALILGLGIPQALIFFAARNTISRDRLLYSCLIYLFASTLVFWGLIESSSILGIQYFFLPEPFTGSIYKIVISLNFLCLLGWYLIISILNGHKFFIQTNLVSFVSITITFIIYIVVFYLFYFSSKKFEANAFYFIQFGAAAVTLALTIYYHSKLVGGEGKLSLVNLSEGKMVIKYGLVYYVSNFLLFANTKLDYWFINYFTGSYDLGIYVLSSNVGLLILLLPNATGLVLSAFKAKSDLKEIELRTAFLCRVTMMTTFAAAVFLWIFCEPIIVFLYGEEFRTSAAPLRIILLGITPFSVFTILKNYFAGADNLKAFLRASLVGFILTILLDVLLIRPYGIIGASAATAISYSASAAYLIAIYSKNSAIKIRDIIFLKREDILLIKNVLINLVVKNGK